MIETLNIKNLWGWKIYKIYIFLSLLASFKAWFFWGVNDNYTAILSIAIGIFVSLSNPRLFGDRIDGVWVLVLFLSLLTSSIIIGITGVISKLLIASPLLFILWLKPAFKEDLLYSLQKYIAILMGISVVGWIVNLIGISTPSIMLSLGETETGADHYVFENHYAFLVNVTTLDNLILPRFSSVFVEPGYLGCLMALNLFIGKYKFNKFNAVFYASLFFSFSLAGYILLLIGMTFVFWKNIKRHKGFSFGLLFLVISIIVWGQFANDGDNIVNQAILQRLEYDSSRNTISGYNRSKELNDRYFWNTFIYENDFWFGKKQNNLDSNDVDWKSYIVLHGFISFFFWIIYLLRPALSGRNRKESAMLSILYLGIFSQTLHMAHSLMYLTIYMLGVIRIKRDKKNEKITASTYSISGGGGIKSTIKVTS